MSIRTVQFNCTVLIEAVIFAYLAGDLRFSQ